MKTNLPLVLLMTSFIFASIHSQPALQWAVRFKGPILNDRGNALTVDSSGNVYVTGYIDGRTGGHDYNTIKYNKFGDTLWSRSYNGSANGQDEALAIKVDKLGNVYVTGKSQGKGTNFDIVTIKYSSNGTQSWINAFNGKNNPDDIGYDLVVDASGSNIYVVGSTDVEFYGGVLIKYSTAGAGAFQWSKSIYGNSSNKFLMAMNQNDGNIIVAGGFDFYDPYVVIAYDPMGNVANPININGNSNYSVNGIPNALVLDASGNIYITSTSVDMASTTPHIVQTTKFKYVGGGDADKYVWSSYYTTFSSQSTVGVDLKIDANNYLYELVDFYNGNRHFYKITKYSNPSGAVECVQVYLSKAGIDDFPVSLALSNKNISNPDLYITGFTSTGDINTVKYSNNCDSLWSVAYDCGTKGVDVATNMLVDQFDNIYITGYSNCNGTSQDVKTIKYCVNAPDAIITANGSSKICKGDSLKLSVSQCSGCKYKWSTNETTPSITVSPVVNKSYTATVNDSKFCDGISTPFDVTLVAVPAQPDTIIGSLTACIGINNSYSIPPVNGASSYKWLPPSGSGWSVNGNPDSASIIFKAGSAGGTISVVAVNACGDESVSRTLKVSTHTIPAKPGSISGDVTLCEGVTYPYTIIQVFDATSYRWAWPDQSWSGNSTTTSVISKAGKNSGNIKVFAVNECGDSQPQDLQVSILPVPDQPTSIIGDSLICPNSKNIYRIVPLLNAISYAWNNNQSWKDNKSNSDTIEITATTPFTTISVLGRNMCGDGQSIMKFISAPPVDTSITLNNKTFTAKAINVTYQWIDCFDFMPIQGETKKSFTPQNDGKYYVRINQNNCVDSSSCWALITAVDEQNLASKFTVYPNPVSKMLQIEGSTLTKERFSIVLYNSLRQKLAETNISSTDNAIKTQFIFDEYPDGIYMVAIHSNNFKKLFKVQKF